MAVHILVEWFKVSCDGRVLGEMENVCEHVSAHVLRIETC